MNSLIGSAAVACIEHVFVNLARPADGHKPRYLCSRSDEEPRNAQDVVRGHGQDADRGHGQDAVAGTVKAPFAGTVTPPSAGTLKPPPLARSSRNPRARSRNTPGAPIRATRRGYTARPRACGGIGRRARLRALWTEWSVEVRVLSGALELWLAVTALDRRDRASRWRLDGLPPGAAALRVARRRTALTGARRQVNKRGGDTHLAPRVSIICLELRASALVHFGGHSGSRLKSRPQGGPHLRTPLPRRLYTTARAILKTG